VWRVYPDEGYEHPCWLMGLWSTQTKLEGIVLKAAWHWVVIAVSETIPLGNQAAPHLCRPSVGMGHRGR